MRYKHIDGENENDFKAPLGQFRVILYDTYTFKHYFIEDFTDFSIAKDKAKELEGEGAGFYHTTVYDEKGEEKADYGDYS